MSTVNLTEGGVIAMCEGENTDLQPVLQVADLRLLNTHNPMSSTERYRLMLSDGVHVQQGMLATQHNSMVTSGALQKGSIIRLTQFARNRIQQRLVIIMTELEVLEPTCPLIGEPKLYNPNSIISESSSVRQSELIPGAQSVNYHPTGPSPTYNPTAQSSSTSQSFGSPSTINPDSGRFSAYNGHSVYSGSEFSDGVSGNSRNGGTYFGFNNNGNPNISRPPLNTYARPQQPMYTTRGPIARDEAPPRIIPIAALNPFQGRWAIKARVTTKSELRQYHNTRGEGKVFSFDLLDADGGEIRATCFNAVADQFFPLIEVGRVYLISKGTVKPAEKKFNHLPNDHQITLDSTSLVQPCYDYDDDSRIPSLQFHFRPISDIEGMEVNSVLDVIGVVSAISPTATIQKQDGTETQKRSLQLRDMSGRSVEITMWGNFCNAEGQTLQNLRDAGKFPVLAMKAARISEFNGKNLGTISSSQLFIDPDSPEAIELKVWFEQEGRNLSYVSLSRESMGSTRNDARKTISQIKDAKLGQSEKPDWITVCATLSFMKMDNFCYTACPIVINDRQCNKKVLNNGDGKWRCDKCDQSVDECDYRYILQIQIQDHTGLTWATAFQECGEEILGVSAKELFELKYDNQDEDKFQEIIRSALFSKYIFKLKVKEEVFSDEARVKSTVVKVEKVNNTTESKFLLDMINKLKIGDLDSHVKSENTTTANQYGNQYNGGYGGYCGTSRSGMYTTCTSCGGTSHNSTNCPSIINSPGQSLVNQALPGTNNMMNTTQCYKCQKFGHFARDCPGISSVPPTYGANITCTSCGGLGHNLTNCPSIINGPRQSLMNQAVPGTNNMMNTTQCYKCQKFGHFARDCPGISSVPPTYGANITICTSCGGAGHNSTNCPSIINGPGQSLMNQALPGTNNMVNTAQCYKCQKFGHFARDCPGVSSVPPTYGANNGTPGRYGGVQRQYVGGF